MPAPVQLSDLVYAVVKQEDGRCHPGVGMFEVTDGEADLDHSTS
jgi:hypothetical protein